MIIMERNLDEYIVQNYQKAIDYQYIQVYYQPVIRTVSRKLCSFEALARWIDPVYGVIYPDEFIPVLEHIKAIHLLDLCILRQACSRIRHALISGETPIPVSVNLSRLDFTLCDIFTEFDQIVSEYTIKGWVMDVPRLKDGSPISDKYFEHQLERIREIRLSERMFYQKVTDLYATAIDYDRTSNVTRLFYATVQNRMHCAVHGHTAAEILYTRADADKDHMGLTNWEDGPDGKIKKSDVVIAKNYLTDRELAILERMVNAFLDYAETQTLRNIPLTMEDWKKRLDKFLELFDRHAPKYAGDPVTAYQAQLYAESEFEKYRVLQDRLFMSDYDRYLLELEEQVKKEKDDFEDSK